MNHTTIRTNHSYDSDITTLPLKVTWSARLLVAAMLLFFALFFGYYLVLGLIEYIKYATWQEWVQNSWGFALNLGLVLLFAVPAGMALFGRSSVTIDKHEGTLTAVRDWRLFKQVERHALADVTAVLATTQITRHKEGPATVSYMVELLLHNHNTVLVALPDDEEVAQAEAAELAAYLNLPWQERTIQ